MKCPTCHEKTKCRDSRDESGYRRRRYRCANGHWFSTMEVFAVGGPGNRLVPEDMAKWQLEFLDILENQLATMIISQRKSLGGANASG